MVRTENSINLKFIILKNLLLLICIILNSFTAQLQNLFFPSPEKSVEIITQLLKSENWSTLSNYYYTIGVNQELIDSIMSGEYFLRREMPEVAHPAGFWKYRHPFPPGFNYSSHEKIKENLIKVNLIIEIDQGEGLTQVGKASFLLRKFHEGYKILPEQPQEETRIN
jgi:hypothetical protein